MNAADLRRLEAHLIAAEECFDSDVLYTPTALGLRAEISTVLARVVAERIRSEEREHRLMDPQ